MTKKQATFRYLTATQFNSYMANIDNDQNASFVCVTKTGTLPSYINCDMHMEQVKGNSYILKTSNGEYRVDGDLTLRTENDKDTFYFYGAKGQEYICYLQ